MFSGKSMIKNILTVLMLTLMLASLSVEYKPQVAQAMSLNKGTTYQVGTYSRVGGYTAYRYQCMGGKLGYPQSAGGDSGQNRNAYEMSSYETAYFFYGGTGTSGSYRAPNEDRNSYVGDPCTYEETKRFDSFYDYIILKTPGGSLNIKKGANDTGTPFAGHGGNLLGGKFKVGDLVQLGDVTFRWDSSMHDLTCTGGTFTRSNEVSSATRYPPSEIDAQYNAPTGSMIMSSSYYGTRGEVSVKDPVSNYMYKPCTENKRITTEYWYTFSALMPASAPPPPPPPPKTCAEDITKCTTNADKCKHHGVNCPPPVLSDLKVELVTAQICYGYEEAVTLAFNKIETWTEWDRNGNEKPKRIEYVPIKYSQANSVTAKRVGTNQIVNGTFSSTTGDKIQFKMPKSYFIGVDGRQTANSDITFKVGGSFSATKPTVKTYNAETPEIKIINVPIYTGGPCEGLPPPTCASDITKCTTDGELCTFHGIYCPIEGTPDVSGGGVTGNIPPPQEFEGWPSWSQDDFITKIPVTPNPNRPSDVAQLENKDKSNKLDIRITNVPNNEILSVSEGSFKPELILRNNNDTYEFPNKENLDWVKYTNQGNKTTVFILKVLDPTTLPTDPKNLFNWSNNKFEYKDTVTGNGDTLKDYKIDESGYYVFGAKVEDNQGRVGYDFRVAKVIFTDNFGWLPVQNNLLQQISEHMLVTNWDNGEHGIDLMYNNSLKIPSAYNYKQKVTAIGSYNGGTGVHLYRDDISQVTMVSNIPPDAKVTSIREYQDGFLVSVNTTSLSSGLMYLNVKENTVSQIEVGSKNVNYFLVDNLGNIYVGTDKGLTVGHLTGTTFTEHSTENNIKLFGNESTQISSIELVLGKLLITSKTGTDGVSEVIIVDTM